MQFRYTLTMITYLASTTLVTAEPSIATPEWNDLLKVYDIGTVPNEPGQINVTALSPGSCQDTGIPQGGYVCGSFHSEGVVAMRAIYICVNGQFIRTEMCKEKTDKDRCVKNQRRPHHKFYPAVDGEKIVCRRQRDVEKP